jgi:hypothetical protein
MIFFIELSKMHALITCRYRGVINGKVGKAAALPKISIVLTLS